MTRQLISLVLLLFFVNFTNAQDITISANSSELALGEELILKLTVKKTGRSKVSSFPQINGFKMKGRTGYHKEIKENGQKLLLHVLEQKYIAESSGLFTTDTLQITIDGQVYEFDPIEVSVAHGEFKEASEDSKIFLNLDVNKNQVYVSEGLIIKVSLIAPESSNESYHFGFTDYLTKEINDISKSLTFEGCIKDRFNISDIRSEKINYNGTSYNKFLLFQSVYYPYTDTDIEIPSVSLNVERISSVDSNTAGVLKVRSKPLSIKVTTTPEHPLENSVAVGTLTMSSTFKSKKLTTGRIYEFPVKIKGAANLKVVSIPQPANDSYFDFYPPKVNEKASIGNNYGEKTFLFKVYPKKSGEINLGTYFPLVFFNTSLSTYDTLNLQKKVTISGEEIVSKQNTTEDIYSDIESLDINAPQINYRRIIENIVNILLILGIAAVIAKLYWTQNK